MPSHWRLSGVTSQSEPNIFVYPVGYHEAQPERTSVSEVEPIVYA